MKPNLTFEFHISLAARQRYAFDQSLFGLSGNVIFANFHAARVFAQKMNARRDLARYPELAVKAGQITAMGLIDEILHYIARQYRQQLNPKAFEKALAWLETQLGETLIQQALQQFSHEFPPRAVYQGELSVDEYLAGETEGLANRQIALEEMLMLWLANANPAFSPYRELFDDQSLVANTIYPQIIGELELFFDTQPRFGPDQLPLIKLLRVPALAVPHSLTGQLEYIREKWNFFLGSFLMRLLSSIDLIKEEEKPVFFGPGPSEVPQFAGEETMLTEDERFSPDSDWMPRVVLLAKNSYVWLDQLSKQYHRPIRRLDQIPDEELDKLARWGMTSLWLIGLWERSAASQRIKQLCGNPDAVPSAYSLFDYVIAEDLGGETAYQQLRHRAWQRGIRLAADMVPNHVGIYSKWVLEHPEWFVSLSYPPFPGYSFNGPDLSTDGRVGIYLEDHYYDRSDAAVVFKRVDYWSGDTRYIYHGNDGTAMPWNDTAQLNYLQAEVREAVIQTILHVARKFPIIRFDAAMTLAKKHYQRLWFPRPGTGGDIPTRSEFGLTQEEFEAAFPQEFWREVVDRVAQEVPDTLLLAEAFWMMEGYFVRTLGMHRVYNSAFMHMLRDERNDEYRQLIKNTIEFDPQILKRYVNFMNNPDEETAVAQFGKDDKYFGISTLMSTLPGLPMFGHGQVEGFHEKYGMEYRRAYWEEEPDQHLVHRHERAIFPLLHKRYLFAEVENFRLYDFYTPAGQVNQDVLAYSNRHGDEYGLVIYHNRWADTRGWIKSSAAYLDKNNPDAGLQQRDLASSLSLHDDPQTFTLFRDHVNGLYYIRNNREVHTHGLYVELGAYKHQVFLDFRQVPDNEWGQYAQLNTYLNGRGVPDMHEALQEIILQPLHYPFKELVNPGMFQWLLDNRAGTTTYAADTMPQIMQETEQKMLRFLSVIASLIECQAKLPTLAAETSAELEIALHLAALPKRYPRLAAQFEAILEMLALQDGGKPFFWGTLFAWLFTHNLGKALCDTDAAERSRSLVQEWLLQKIVAQTLQAVGLSSGAARGAVDQLQILIAHQDWADSEPSALAVLESWLADQEIQQLIGINRYQGVVWFNKEAFDSLLQGMLATAVVAAVAGAADSGADDSGGAGVEARLAQTIAARQAVIARLSQAAVASGYQVERLLAAAQEP